MKKVFVVFIILFSWAITKARSDAVENTYFTHLQQIYFENTSGRYNSYLLPALKNFFVRFPHSAQEDQVTFMLANIYQQKQRDFSAFYYFTRLLFVYPASTLLAQAEQNADSLLQGSRNMAFHERSDSLRRILKTVTPGSEQQENLFAFFSFIYMLNVDSLQQDLLEDIYRYRTVFGMDAPYGDLLLMWKAKIYLHAHEYFAARASLLEFIALFPQSAIMPKVLLTCAQISAEPLQAYDAAKKYFVQLINDFPDSPQSAEAQFFLGRLYEKDLHNRRLAVENYRLFLQNFPQHRLRCRAFARLGPLLTEEENYTEALQTYMQYYQACADSAGALNALQQILYLANNKLHDAQRSAKTLLLLAAHSDNDSLSAAYLYRAAATFAGTADQKKRAEETCRLLIKRFPDTESAIRAKRLLESLEKK